MQLFKREGKMYSNFLGEGFYLRAVKIHWREWKDGGSGLRWMEIVIGAAKQLMLLFSCVCFKENWEDMK